jgi:hypothetical protein
MREVQSTEEFEHHHEDGVKDLVIEAKSMSELVPDPALVEFDQDLRILLESIVKDLQAGDAPEPKAVFRTAVAGMEAVDRKRFVLENLLESLKHGTPPAVAVQNLRNVGLIGGAPNTPPAPAARAAAAARIASPALGSGIAQRLGKLKSCFLALAQLGTNALFTIPKFVEIEPQITILPIPSLGFTVKGKGMSLYELFNLLRAPGKFFGSAAG